jgi:hypothetical protein
LVWISPGPDIEVVIRCWLADAGLTRRPYVSYLTLARDARQTAPAATGFDVREVDPQEVERLSGRLDGIVGPEYLRSLGAPGAHHFMAFEGEQPVASAVLYAFEELGYLGMALTTEPFRRRGAQSGLITRRIKKAVEVGCKIVVSETLSVAKHSLGNLQKAGFDAAYEKEVYGFADDEPRVTSRHGSEPLSWRLPNGNLGGERSTLLAPLPPWAPKGPHTPPGC